MAYPPDPLDIRSGETPESSDAAFSLRGLREWAERERKYATVEELNNWPVQEVLALLDVVEIVKRRRARFKLLAAYRDEEEIRLDTFLERFGD